MFSLYEYLIIGFLLHLVILAGIYYKNLLRWPDGIVMAAFVSFIIYCAGMIYWIILLVFFIPSSILTKLNMKRKSNKIIEEKSGNRDGYQVLANSLGLFIFSLAQLMVRGIAGEVNLLYLIIGASFIASASSDTWSTEIGTLNKTDPRYILNLKKKVPKGTSGGISTIGTLGGLIGAFVIALTVIIGLLIMNYHSISTNFLITLIVFITGLGFLGQIIDSLLGATFQSKYFCPNCNLNVEKSNHESCGTLDLQKISSWTFLNNNTVNITSNSFITILSFVLIIVTNFNLNF